MRVLFGIILGVFLTIGFAYVYDASTTHTSAPTAQTSPEQRPMVNWDVAAKPLISGIVSMSQTRTCAIFMHP
jgi:hypothetical protein